MDPNNLDLTFMFFI